MHLPADFDEAARRIEMVADFVVGHRFDHRECHPLLTKIVQCVFDELSAQPASPRIRHDGEIRNPSLTTFAIYSSRDVAGDVAVRVGHEESGGGGRDGCGEGPGLAPAPRGGLQVAENTHAVLL